MSSDRSYRVIRRRSFQEITQECEDLHGVHEVYYGGDRVKAWSDAPTAVVGDTPEEVTKILSRMLEGTQK